MTARAAVPARNLKPLAGGCKHEAPAISRARTATRRSQNISRRPKVRNVRFAFMLSTQPCELPLKVFCALLDTINCTPPPSFQIVRRNIFFWGWVFLQLIGCAEPVCFEAKPSFDSSRKSSMEPLDFAVSLFRDNSQRKQMMQREPGKPLSVGDIFGTVDAVFSGHFLACAAHEFSNHSALGKSFV